VRASPTQNPIGGDLQDRKDVDQPSIDLEDHCLQTVASSVARREIRHIAMVALQECLPEGNGMQRDLDGR